MNKGTVVALVGNPNTGKSTIFNRLTGADSPTGNWTGKTVGASAPRRIRGTELMLVDLPGMYSLVPRSPDEQAARSYIEGVSTAVVVLDALTLERGLCLLIQVKELVPNVIAAVNFLDVAARKKIKIDLAALSQMLDITVVGVSGHGRHGMAELVNALNNPAAWRKNQLDILYSLSCERAIDLVLPVAGNRRLAIESICNPSCATADAARQRLQKDAAAVFARELSDLARQIYSRCCTCPARQKPKDRLLSGFFGTVFLLLFFGLLLFVTIFLAGWVSEGLSYLLGFLLRLGQYLTSSLHSTISSFVLDGILAPTLYVVAVMLPPMAIFFPLFQYLEDLGLLPRVAYRLDGAFAACGCGGRQALTVCMGLGCNACGVTGARIIPDKNERAIAIITNSLTPCNGRFPLLIAVAAALTSGALGALYSALILCGAFALSLGATLLTSLVLSKFFKTRGGFVLELPPYRMPRLQSVATTSLKKTLHILLRAVVVTIPAGAVLWCLCNVSADGKALFAHVADALDPFARLLGMDGVILCGFFLALPANEIVLPIIVAGYTGEVVLSAGALPSTWSVLTLLNVMLFCLFHFPCATTLLTIYRETRSPLIVALSFALPLAIGILLTLLTTLVFG